MQLKSNKIWNNGIKAWDFCFNHPKAQDNSWQLMATHYNLAKTCKTQNGKEITQIGKFTKIDSCLNHGFMSWFHAIFVSPNTSQRHAQIRARHPRDKNHEKKESFNVLEYWFHGHEYLVSFHTCWLLFHSLYKGKQSHTKGPRNHCIKSSPKIL